MSEISYFRPIRPIQAVGIKCIAFLRQYGKFTCRRLFCENLYINIYIFHLQKHNTDLQSRIYADCQKIGVMPLPGGSLIHEPWCLSGSIWIVSYNLCLNIMFSVFCKLCCLTKM